jgi:hypothetical protein
MTNFCKECDSWEDNDGNCHCAVNAAIAQLTAEVERLQRVVEQATRDMEIDSDGLIGINKRFVGFAIVGNKDTEPDLYAQLKGAEPK